MMPGHYWAEYKNAMTIDGKREGQAASLAIRFTVTNVAVDGSWKPLPGPKEVTVFLSLSDKAWPYTEEKLDAHGFNDDFDNPTFTGLGEGAALVCKHQIYKGQNQERWDFERSGELEKASDATIRELNLKRKASRKPAVPAGRPTPPKRQPAAPPAAGMLGAGAPQDEQDDDIPF